MIKKTETARRVTIVLIILSMFIIGMRLSQLFLSILAQRISGEFPSLIFAVFMVLIWIMILVNIYKPMNRLLKEILTGASSLLSKSMMVFCGILVLFGFGAGIVIVSFTGLLIYTFLGG